MTIAQLLHDIIFAESMLPMIRCVALIVFITLPLSNFKPFRRTTTIEDDHSTMNDSRGSSTPPTWTIGS